jgi:hypothetical protein
MESARQLLDLTMLLCLSLGLIMLDASLIRYRDEE